MLKHCVQSNEALQESSEGIRNTLAEKVWQLNWGDYFPYYDENHAVLYERTDYDGFVRFMRASQGVIKHTTLSDSRFLTSGSGATKNRYYDLAADIFVFKKEHEPIGIFLGNLMDWSTYYLRYACVLPEYRRQGVWRNFLDYLLEILRVHRVHRVEGEVYPTNQAEISFLNKQGFVVTGNRLTDRWGSLLIFTKFIQPKNKEVFLEQFCLFED